MSATETPLLAIVDDDPDSARTLAGMLDSFGCASELHFNADSVVRAMKSTKYSLIFLDLSMPGTDGIELLQNFAQMGMEVPLVLISGHFPSVLDAAKTIAVQSGLLTLGTLTKPIRITDIAELLSTDSASPQLFKVSA